MIQTLLFPGRQEEGHSGINWFSHHQALQDNALFLRAVWYSVLPHGAMTFRAQETLLLALSYNNLLNILRTVDNYQAQAEAQVDISIVMWPWVHWYTLSQMTTSLHSSSHRKNPNIFPWHQNKIQTPLRWHATQQVWAGLCQPWPHLFSITFFAVFQHTALIFTP